MTDTVKWIDPPFSVKGGGNKNYAQFIPQLKAKPGTWARIDNQPVRGSLASNGFSIRTGRIRSFGPAGTFSSCTRTELDGTVSLYVKFNGSK